MAATNPTDSQSGSKRTTSLSEDQGIAQTARNVADSVAGAAGEVTSRIPEVTQSTKDALTEANRMVHRGSDDTLRIIGSASIGFAVGLLVGGANRILIVASLVPAALIGATMVERMDQESSVSRALKSRV
ncbi:MAG: hypothetical protein ABIP77_09695 [Candidatus Limnocylindrales bacterium]